MGHASANDILPSTINANLRILTASIENAGVRVLRSDSFLCAKPPSERDYRSEFQAPTYSPLADSFLGLVESFPMKGPPILAFFRVQSVFIRGYLRMLFSFQRPIASQPAWALGRVPAF